MRVLANRLGDAGNGSRGVESRYDTARVSDIELDRVGLPSCAANLLDQRIQSILATGERNDVRSMSRQQCRRIAANTARSTGYQRGLAGERELKLFHRLRPSLGPSLLFPIQTIRPKSMAPRAQPSYNIESTSDFLRGGHLETRNVHRRFRFAST
jgi:hypothetical protein